MPDRIRRHCSVFLAMRRASSLFEASRSVRVRKDRWIQSPHGGPASVPQFLRAVASRWAPESLSQIINCTIWAKGVIAHLPLSSFAVL